MGHVGVAVVAARLARIPEQMEVVVRDQLGVGFLGEAAGAAEVVGVRVGDDDGVYVGHLEPGSLQAFLDRAPRRGTGHADVDDGEAVVVEQAVHVHVPQAGHGDGQLHLEDAVAEVGNFLARRDLLALPVRLRHPG